MKILLTADPELPVPPKLYGGIERIIDSLARKLGERNHNVGLVAHPESTTNVNEFFPWPGASSRSLIDSFRNTNTLKNSISRFNPDVLHSFSRLMYMLPLFRRSIPKIMSYQREPNMRTVRWASRLAGDSIRFTGCGEHVAVRGRQAGGQWFGIHNFVELDKFTFIESVSVDAPLVFLSRLDRIKGAHNAIEIAKRTGQKLIIAGNYAEQGEDAMYWQDVIKPEIGKNNIEYIGPVDDVQKNELLGQAKAMIVPIEWDEPFGIVFAESLACGTPVISSPRGALPEIVRQGIDGFLVNSIDEGVLAASKLDSIDRKNCRMRVEEKFTVDVICDAYETLYRSMIK